MFLTMNTLDLRIGDVVMNHGMRIKLDRHPRIWFSERRRGGAEEVRTFPGLVLNPDEAITKHAIPRGWIYDSRGTWDYETSTWLPEIRPRWTVQGNRLATWYVDREHEIGC